MRNLNYLRNGTLLLALACLIGTSACSSAQADVSSAASADAVSTQAAASGAGSKNENAVYGKVTAVDGSTITLAVGTLNTEDSKGERTGGVSGSSGTGEGPDKGQPRGGNGSRPEDAASGINNASHPNAGDGFGSMLTLTGETKTITISDESILSKQQMKGGRGPKGTSSGESKESQTASEQTVSASLSDIQEGTTLRVTYQSDGKTLASVDILGGKQQG